jgi:hypothetical protein
MMTRLMAITGLLAAGHAVLFAAFWLLLSIPESNATMLAASVLTVALVVWLFGWVEAMGLLWWADDEGWRTLPRRAARANPGVLAGAALYVAVWYLVAYAGAWWHGRQGEIDAWLMVQFGWADTGKLHAAVGWLLVAVRIIGLSLAASFASAVAGSGVGEIGHGRWVRAGVSPRRLALLAAILALFFWLPWQGVAWRPGRLAPNWQEALFVGAKLGVLYLVANAGWALVLGLAARTAPRRPGPDGARP